MIEVPTLNLASRVAEDKGYDVGSHVAQRKSLGLDMQALVGSMYPDGRYFGTKAPILYRDCFKAKVDTIWVHGPSGNCQRASGSGFPAYAVQTTDKDLGFASLNAQCRGSKTRRPKPQTLYKP